MNELNTNTDKPMTIGQQIGRIQHSLRITNDFKEKVELNIVIDFTESNDQEIICWLASNRTIAAQRPWRALNADELRELEGKVFHASDIGCKIRSKEEQISALVSAGLPRKLAEFSVDNPEKLSDLMNDIE